MDRRHVCFQHHRRPLLPVRRAAPDDRSWCGQWDASGQLVCAGEAAGVAVAVAVAAGQPKATTCYETF